MGRRPSGDGSIHKRNDGRWEGRIVVGHKSNGAPIYKSAFGKTQKELLPKLNKLKETYAGIELTEDSLMTLAQWLDKWLDEYKIGMIRSSTLIGYKHYVNSYIKPHLGSKKLTQITSKDVQEMYNALKEEGRINAVGEKGKELSNATVRSVHMLLHEALDGAVREGLIPRNPTDGTTIPRLERTEKTVLLESQIEKFMKTIENDEEWHDLFFMELMMGFRVGEICGLKWSDINEDSGVIHVQRTIRYVNGELNVGETKTNRGNRKIVLPASVREMLTERKKKSYSEWIFPKSLNPTMPISSSSANKRLKQILAEAGLPNMRFHDLRHTFATHAAASGIDPRTLAGILGHTKPSFTLDAYTHVTTDMQKRAAGIVGNFITDTFGKELKPWSRKENRAKAR